MSLIGKVQVISPYLLCLGHTSAHLESNSDLEFQSAWSVKCKLSYDRKGYTIFSSEERGGAPPVVHGCVAVQHNVRDEVTSIGQYLNDAW